MKSIKILSLLALTIFSTNALADYHEDRSDRSHESYSRGTNDGVRSCISNYKNSSGNYSSGRGDSKDGKDSYYKSTKTQTVQCGDTITSSITLKNDLYCPDTTGSALYIIGDNISVNGNGKKIYAPNASSGIFVQGNGNSVSGFQVNGISQGYGILAYESSGLTLSLNDFSNNLIGVMLYADQKSMSKDKVFGNVVRNSTLFAIRSGSDGAGSIIDPAISWNDFSNSGSYAMQIKASIYNISDYDYNLLFASRNGLYLSGSQINISNFSLTKHNIKETGIFIDSATNVNISGIDLSSNVTGDSNQKRMGMDLYRVQNFSINGLKSNNNDVGLKFETELGTSPHGTVSNCQFKNAVVSGVMIVSYDATSYGDLLFVNNDYSNTNNPVILGSTTLVGSGSVF